MPLCRLALCQLGRAPRTSRFLVHYGRSYSVTSALFAAPKRPPPSRTQNRQLPITSKDTSLAHRRQHDELRAKPDETRPPLEQEGSASSTDLIPRTPGSITELRKKEIPVRVLPKAKLSKDVTLTPKQQMEVEYFTRKPPRPAEEKCKAQNISTALRLGWD